jgi:hypothetical protein
MGQLSEETQWLIIMLSASSFSIHEIKGAIGCDIRTGENTYIDSLCSDGDNKSITETWTTTCYDQR